MRVRHFYAAALSVGTLFGGGAYAQEVKASATNGSQELIVITAPREEEAARAKQQDAPNLVIVQSADTILKYPDFNAAESLGRLPGISISTDTGEGRFVNIRGIDGNLAGATFGGVPLLNTNPGGTYFGGGGRAVEFDTIPNGSIDGLVLTKTTLPDHEAEGLGGTVELTPRTALNVAKPFFDGTIGWGYEPAHDHAGPFNIEGAGGGRFGLGLGGQGWISNAQPFAVVITGSRRDDRRGFDDLEGDYNDVTVNRSLSELQLRRYDYNRRRFGYGGELDFKPNDDHRYYVRANVAGYIESVKKNRLTYGGLGNDVDPANPKGFATTASLSIASTDEEETHRNSVFALGGVDRFGDAALDYRASYSRATFSVGRNYGAKFTGPTLAFAYDNSANDGDKPNLVVNNAIVNNPTNYNVIKKVSNSTVDDTDEEYAYAANLTWPLHLLAGADSIKIGAQARLRDKASTPRSFKSVIPSLALSSASSSAITDFYGRYTNGPNVDIVAVRNAYRAGVVTENDARSGVFTAEENIYAGYGQYETKLGKWGVLAGVRVEQTDATYGAFSDDNATGDLLFVKRSADYTDVFPSVQVRYEFNPHFLVRAVYSTGIGRPGFLQNTAAVSSNHDATDPQITQGNPGLKPTKGQNFDLSIEYYLPHGGILQIGAFDKEFDNYIVKQFQKRLYSGTDPEFAGLNVGYTTFANRGGAYARGLEAAYHQQFEFLPDLWKGFGVDANVTLVESHIQEYDAATSGTGRAESGLLPGTSRQTWNLAGFYEAHGVQVRLAGEYVSRELFGLGGQKSLDVIQDDRLTMDFSSSYQITSSWTVYFNAKNLTNEPLRFHYGAGTRFPIQREYYDVTYEAGLRTKF